MTVQEGGLTVKTITGVISLLRLMGNKGDVVKGLAKRCDESWSMAPKSDIVRPCALSENNLLNTSVVALTGLVPL